MLRIPVRTYDIDFAGIVSNIVYVRWLEDLRLQVLAEYFPLEQAMRDDGIHPVLLRTAIEYSRPIRLFDQVTARMWAASLGRARMSLEAEFMVGGQIHARAEQVGCFVQVTTGRPVPMPAAITERFKAAGQPAPDAG